MRLKGTIQLPGDKSISHRAIMLSSIGYGEAKISNLLISEDTKATIQIFRDLGVPIVDKQDYMHVIGSGFEGLNEVESKLDCLNSGTTARLLMGLLSGLSKSYTLIGDDSLSKRPMMRVVKHLKLLGGQVELSNHNYLPASIKPAALYANEVYLDVSSAQVKSAVLLAALKNKETTIVHELQKSRNHTELMLKYLGCDLEVNGLTIKISGKNRLVNRDLTVPGDISSAAFFIVATLINPLSEIIIKNCGINETRIGILKILDQIGADYELLNKREIGYEPVADIRVCYTPILKPIYIEKTLIPDLIDEIPILTLLATQIKGTSIIKDASELRVKETDRIKAVTTELKKLGAKIEETHDGMIIQGGYPLSPALTKSYGDHRISMMLKVARLLIGSFKIEGDQADFVSYPHFESDLASLLK